MEAAKKKGSAESNHIRLVSVSWDQVRKIAEKKCLTLIALPSKRYENGGRNRPQYGLSVEGAAPLG